MKLQNLPTALQRPSENRGEGKTRDREVLRIKQLHEAGYRVSKIAKETGIAYTQVKRIVLWLQESANEVAE